MLIEEGLLSLLAILWRSVFSWLYLSLSPSPFASVNLNCNSTLVSYMTLNKALILNILVCQSENEITASYGSCEK